MAEATQMPLAQGPAMGRSNEALPQKRDSGDVAFKLLDGAMPLDLHYPTGDKSLWDRITDPTEFDRMAPITMMFLGAGFVTSLEQLLARLAASHPGFVAKLAARLGWLKGSPPTSSSNAAKVVDASSGKGVLEAEPLPKAKAPTPMKAAQSGLIAERELLLKQQYFLYRQKLMTEDEFLDAVARANTLHQATIGPTTKVLSTGEKVVIRTAYRENYILVEVSGPERSIRMRFSLQTEAGRQSERESLLMQLYVQMPEIAQAAPVAASKNLPVPMGYARAAGPRSWIPQQLDEATVAAETRLRELIFPVDGRIVNPDAVASAVQNLNRTAVKSSWAVLRDPVTGEVIEDVSFFWEYLSDGSISMTIAGSRTPVVEKFGPEFLGNITSRIDGLVRSYLKERPALPVRELR